MDKPANEPASQQQEQARSELEFSEHEAPSDWKAILLRPTTIAGLAVAIIIVGLVAYLEFVSIESGLPVPEVSYVLLPNEGRTEGVPIAIKLNQIAVFVIDDPMAGGGGASRAPELVERLQNAVSDLKANPGKAITYVTEDGLPEILLQNMDGTERRVLVKLAEGDLALAGVTDAKRVARVWAERLTDTLKVVAFGEAPEFSVGTDFYQALEAMYLAAQGSDERVSKSSLDEAFAALSDSQRLALETIPRLEPGEEEAEVASVVSGQ